MSISLADAEAIVRSRASRFHGQVDPVPGASVGTSRRGDTVLVDATHDSTQVRPGWLFCAVPGQTVDGHRFAGAAVEAGAAALLVERWLDEDLPQLRVDMVRSALGPVAAAVHGNPSEHLTVVGVTGTNGKTTVAYLLEAAFGAAARGTGVIGTVETRIHGTAQPGVRTTPEATDLQRLLARMRASGVDAVAMEVSSHGLEQQRVDATAFDVGVFTNLTQDHLDYHGSLERYYQAKARLFSSGFSSRGLVCIDDEWGTRLARESEVPTTTYGTAEDADVRVMDVDTDAAGTRCRVQGVLGDASLTTRLLGEHNAWNAAAAYAAAVLAGVDSEAAAAGIAACEGVPGRFEPVDAGQPFTVVVDYAHTPDALERAVAAARRLAGADATVHVVVGCGGDRDREKRPAMGRIAARAGRAILTSDNPRSEDPLAILDEVAAGARDVAGADVVVEPDRRTAIGLALDAARPGDVVVVAGKGHETGQEIGDEVRPFDDRDVARQWLATRGFSPKPEGGQDGGQGVPA